MIMLTALLLSTVGAAPASFVVVVGNNSSPTLNRPQLSYADDDAVRYSEVFNTVLAGAKVELLTELDGDTARLFPGIDDKATAPTLAAVREAFARMREWSANAKRSGQTTRGYFVFAGHGDIDAGEGFLELKDGRLTAREMERLLEGSGTDEMHVVLDSCNSWFVLSPRKPGGTRFPTPADATRALVERLPKVGVLLSTSAEADVYEWSELQSGIFSYAIRSGLMGGADANGDGDIAYDELAAFVSTATRAIKNPALRPQIFARGPGGSLGRGFATLDENAPVTLTAGGSGPVRLRLRDQVGIRWLDVNVMQGPVTLRLPPGLAVGGVVERFDAGGWTAVALPAQLGAFDLGALTEPTVVGQKRGASEVLAGLFEQPFSAGGVGQWRDEDARAANHALGISKAATERIQNVMRIGAKSALNMRRLQGVSLAGAGAAFGSYLAIVASMTMPQDQRSLTMGLGIGVGVAMAAVGVFMGFRVTPWEEQSGLLDQAIREGRGDEGVTALTAFLDKEDQKAAALRTGGRVGAGVYCALGIGAIIGGAFVRAPELQGVIIGGGALMTVMSGLMFAMSFWIAGPLEELSSVLRDEQRVAKQGLSFGFAPTKDGATVSMSGQF